MSRNCQKNSTISQQNSEKNRLKKGDEENFNRSYDWWSDTPQEWRNDDREESILEPKWNRSLSNTNELSEEEVRTTRKLIRGGRRNRDSSESETRIQSRVKWQLQPDQQKDADSRLSSFWQLVRGE